MAHSIAERPSAGTSSVQPGNNAWILGLFFFVLLMPFSFHIAGIRLSPLRLFTLISVVPLFIALFKGRGGRLITADFLIMGYSLWMVISLVAHHGSGRLPLSLANSVETIASYLLGRILIRGPDDYRRIFIFALISLLVLFPAAVYELFTGTIIIAKLFDPVFDVIFRGASADGRLGLERVYAVFGHPILFGLYCAVMVANFVVIFHHSRPRMILALLLASVMAFMALSSAPLLALVLQLMLLAWWRLTNGAWWTLAVLLVAGYILVDVAANRTPLSILFSYATLNPRSGWIRIAIFEYGSQTALNNPVLGIGMNNWPRPGWVPNSIDNFWLVIAVRHGMPALLFLAGAILFQFLSIIRAQLPEGRIRLYRLGYLISLIGVMFTLATVHIWDSAYAFIIFLLGAGSWFYTADLGEGETTATPRRDPARGPTVYSRFPPKLQQQ